MTDFCTHALVRAVSCVEKVCRHEELQCNLGFYPEFRHLAHVRVAHLVVEVVDNPAAVAVSITGSTVDGARNVHECEGELRSARAGVCVRVCV